MLHVSLFLLKSEGAAYAVGSAWSEKANARIVHERDVVLFDEAAGIEHLVVQVRFQTDAKEHGLIVPMPSAPLADRGYAIEDEILFGRLESLVRYDDPKFIPDYPEMEMLAQTTARTAQGTVMPDASALADWLKLEKFPGRPALTKWLSSYTKQGFALNAVRLADDDATTPTRIMQSPPLRFSFKTKSAYLPYAESPEGAGSIKGHALDVWVVEPTPTELQIASTGKPVKALERRSTTRVSSADLEAAIGKLGTFDPRSSPSWVITRYTERGTGPRVATDDLMLVRGKTFSPRSSSPPPNGGRKAWIALVLGLAAAIAFAYQSSREKKR
jgi:hypothetical protein